MATIVNNPSSGQDSSSNSFSMLIGLILLIFVGFVIFYYGIPAIGRMTSGQQINIPSKIDVNINQSE